MSVDNQLTRQPNGRYDFTIVNGNPVTTTGQSPSILRLLRQAEWIGDDGERSGKDLDDIKFTSSTDIAMARSIIETRLGVLVRMRRLERFNVQSVEVVQTTSGPELVFGVEFKEFGVPPTSQQIRVVK